jgi:hypothetical protein
MFARSFVTSLTGLTPQHICACPKSGHRFPSVSVSTILTNTGDKDIGKVIYCRWNSIGYYHAKSHFQATEANHK